jgi:chaperone modulatory protein CbpM
VRTVRRLQRDLGVNLPGAALALELLDRIAELERSM